MRLSRNALKTVYLKRRGTFTDEYKETYTGFEKVGTELDMVVQDAGGTVNAQIYGESLAYMKSCKYQGDRIKEGSNEKDGLCINVSSTEEPDYIITSISTFRDHVNILAKKVGYESND